ncbi:hypothetical protein L2E82_39692 [Cichorium intybus]|uniref:Uncharacterized protein n=1 Tax=Cichorium intybus TaxID=13427 RepID=A0ACB9AKM6_CICIN|nr:hypothetical protein L2E82_39692 [Cichorium intybus]
MTSSPSPSTENQCSDVVTDAANLSKNKDISSEHMEDDEEEDEEGDMDFNHFLKEPPSLEPSSSLNSDIEEFNADVDSSQNHSPVKNVEHSQETVTQAAESVSNKDNRDVLLFYSTHGSESISCGLGMHTAVILGEEVAASKLTIFDLKNRFVMQSKPGQNKVFVANHTSMMDFIILEQMAAFAVIMQKNPGWVGLLQSNILESVGCIWFNRSEAKDCEIVARKYVQ